MIPSAENVRIQQKAAQEKFLAFKKIIYMTFGLNFFILGYAIIANYWLVFIINWLIGVWFYKKTKDAYILLFKTKIEDDLHIQTVAEHMKEVR